jgi:hypothetical protein
MSLFSNPFIRVIAILTGVLLIVVGGCALFVDVAFSDLCVNDQVVEVFSPNGKLKAVVFRRNCGATTDYSTHVSIVPKKSDLPNDPGNIFTGNHERLIEAKWIDDQRLTISGNTNTEFRRLPEFNGIKITYE